MNRNLILFFMFSVSSVYASEDQNEFQPLVRDVKEIDVAEQNFPRNFRTTQDEIGEAAPQLRLEGLKDLYMGGSAQFTENQLREIISSWNTKVLVIDLREETHLILETHEGRQIPISAFIPLNLGNKGKSMDEIEYEHLRYRNHILEQEIVSLPYGKGDSVEKEDEVPVFHVSNVYTEKEVVEKLNEDYPKGVEYVYLPVTDHRKPTLPVVDLFLDVMRNVKEDKEITLMFHCRAGRGRTGMMMVMRDILENAKKYDLTLQQIIKRQELLGSPDFADVSDDERTEQAQERYEFLNQFYRYAMADDGYEASTSFSSWLKSNPE